MFKTLIAPTLVLLVLLVMSLILLPRTKDEWKEFFIYYIVIVLASFGVSFLAPPNGTNAMILFWLPTLIMGFAFATLLTATFTKTQREKDPSEKNDVRASEIALTIWFLVFLASILVFKFSVWV